MLKESVKMYLDKYFEYWINERGSYPMVPYDYDDASFLFFGEIDDDEYIQWKYKEREQNIDFTTLENKYKIALPIELKEYYNAYYFLQLEGFINGQHVSLTPIVDESDVLSLLEYCLNENNKMITIGTYGNMELPLCFEIETKEIIAYDYEFGSKETVTYSLADLFDKMFPKR